MRCTRPRTVGFNSDGKTICWSQKSYSKEFATFQLPCGKCKACRIENSRQWAVRCVHEAQMYENNSFITLTYCDEKLSSDKLYYVDYQLFAKKLRKHIFVEFIKKFGKANWDLLSKEEKKSHYEKIRIGMMVTGEYGEKTKRPHWHAIIFNWRPDDCEYLRINENGDRIYKSKTLDKLWGKNNPEKKPCEIGDVTLKSAGYVARYALKKLSHGHDQDHDYHPISKKSSKQAIGKKWLEKYWPDIFNYGNLVIDGQPVGSPPRYYEKWLQKNQPEAWEHYVTATKQEKIDNASQKAILERYAQMAENIRRAEHRGPNYKPQVTRHQAQEVILESKLKRLRNNPEF